MSFPCSAEVRQRLRQAHEGCSPVLTGIAMPRYTIPPASWPRARSCSISCASCRRAAASRATRPSPCAEPARVEARHSRQDGLAWLHALSHQGSARVRQLRITGVHAAYMPRGVVAAVARGHHHGKQSCCHANRTGRVRGIACGVRRVLSAVAAPGEGKRERYVSGWGPAEEVWFAQMYLKIYRWMVVDVYAGVPHCCAATCASATACPHAEERTSHCKPLSADRVIADGSKPCVLQ